MKLLFSLLAFGIGFFISCQRDRTQAAEIGQLAWAHLGYALELKDDMAVIDWSRDLEGLDDIPAFQARVGTKIVAEGGNHNFLPSTSRAGVEFDFPDRWFYRKISLNNNQSPWDLLMVYHPGYGPLFWGFFGFAASLLPALAMGFLKPSAPSLFPPSASGKTSEVAIGPSAVTPNPPSKENGKPFLLINKHYLIEAINDKAARLLERDQQELLQSHLFDLKPDPRLMRAIEKNEEVELSAPFISYPSLCAFLKPDPNGTWLILESREESKTP